MARRRHKKSKKSTKLRERDACAKALTTPELLEKILLCLPVKKILFAQRVDKFWQNVIGGSCSIQQVLFFRPLGQELVQFSPKLSGYYAHPAVSGMWHFNSDDSLICRPLINPFLNCSIMEQFREDWMLSDEHFAADKWFRCKKCGHINDPVHSWHPECCVKRSKRSKRAMLKEVLGSISLNRKNATHEKMLFMQPPCAQISMYCAMTARAYNVTNPNGVTIGDIMVAVKNHANGCPKGLSKEFLGNFGWQFTGRLEDRVRFAAGTVSGEEIMEIFQQGDAKRSERTRDRS